MTLLLTVLVIACFVATGALLAVDLYDKHKQKRIQRRIRKYYWHPRPSRRPYERRMWR